MRKPLVVLTLLLLVLTLCSASFAANTEYVLTNDDNPSANSGTIYRLNTTTGALTQIKVLSTGGTGLGFGFFAVNGSTVTQNDRCIFITDPGSNDIAAFAAPSYTKVGNFSDPAFTFSTYAGGGLALTPTGRFLYASYSGSENIGVWSVGAGCTLTKVQAFVPSLGPDFFGAIAVDPSGRSLVFGSDSFQAADLAEINQTTGALTDKGSVSYTGLSSCSGGCFPAGIDFTSDSQIVIFGNASLAGPSVLTAYLRSTGLSHPQFWSMSNSAGAVNVNVPFLGQSAYSTGSGYLYLGASGFGKGYPSGIITANFTKSPLSITVAQSVMVPNPEEYQDSIAVTGSTLVASEAPNLLDTFSIAADGSVKHLVTTTDAQASGEINFWLYPKTR
jgi:Lactonase, 7-bladed beta-propeller